MRFRQVAVKCTVGLGLLGAGFLLTYTGTVPITRSGSGADQYPTSVAALMAPGRQIVLLLIVDSQCAACAEDRFPPLVEAALSSVAREATSRNSALVRIGIALDPDLQLGVEFLGRFGAFDQIAVGSGWANELLLGLPAANLPPVASTPQLIIYDREFTPGYDPAYGAAIPLVRSRRLLANKRGLDEIQAWVRNGVPLPE